MHASQILELIIYAAFLGYFVSMQCKLSGKNTAALEFQQRLAERRKAGKFTLSTDDQKRLNWLGISADVLLCAITVFNAFRK